MIFDIITIFPEFFAGPFEHGIIRRARGAALIQVKIHNLRHWAEGKHHAVDDRPFGGGEGMVLKPEPIFAAVEHLTGARNAEEANARGVRVLLLSPQGRSLNQNLVRELAASSRHIVIICGRYEGVDERVAETLATDEISIGDYVLSGGEPAALVIADTIARLIPGVLGNEQSAVLDSFSRDLLDYPHYTRPPEFRGQSVPAVLLGGNHAEIAEWRQSAAFRKTERNRPDLLESARKTRL